MVLACVGWRQSVRGHESVVGRALGVGIYNTSQRSRHRQEEEATRSKEAQQGQCTHWSEDDHLISHSRTS